MRLNNSGRMNEVIPEVEEMRERNYKQAAVSFKKTLKQFTENHANKGQRIFCTSGLKFNKTSASPSNMRSLLKSELSIVNLTSISSRLHQKIDSSLRDVKDSETGGHTERVSHIQQNEKLSTVLQTLKSVTRLNFEKGNNSERRGNKREALVQAVDESDVPRTKKKETNNSQSSANQSSISNGKGEAGMQSKRRDEDEGSMLRKENIRLNQEAKDLTYKIRDMKLDRFHWREKVIELEKKVDEWTRKLAMHKNDHHQQVLYS